jgi:hypothetical protein
MERNFVNNRSCFWKKVKGKKVKVFHYKPGMALWVPGG